MPEEKQRMQIWPIASGKGGVGKTLLTANLAILFSRMDKNVVLLDADLGASNLHTALGIPHLSTTLNDLLAGDAADLSDLAVDTPFPNLRLIGGSRQLPAYADYQTQLTRRILKGIPQLKADILLIDLGGDISPHILDLFLLSEQGIVAMTNDPASIQNTYQFLKMAVYRKILNAYPNNPLVSYMIHSATYPKSHDRINSVPELIEKISHVDRYYGVGIRKLLKSFSPKVIVNMINHKDDTRAARVVRNASRKFVGVLPELLGTLEYSNAIRSSTLNLRPFITDTANRKSSEELGLIAIRLLKMIEPLERDLPVQKHAPPTPPESRSSKGNEIWLMDNIQHENRPLYVLTERLIQDGVIQTSVYFRGKILFSKKLVYAELKEQRRDVGVLKQLVRKQHLSALKGIQEGRLVFQEDEFF